MSATLAKDDVVVMLTPQQRQWLDGLCITHGRTRQSVLHDLLEVARLNLRSLDDLELPK